MERQKESPRTKGEGKVSVLKDRGPLPGDLDGGKRHTARKKKIGDGIVSRGSGRQETGWEDHNLSRRSANVKSSKKIVTSGKKGPFSIVGVPAIKESQIKRRHIQGN